MKQDLPPQPSSNGSGDSAPEKPQIDYPTEWDFTLFGTSEDLVHAGVKHVLAGREHSLAASKSSKGGKYCSFLLRLVVADETDRLDTGAQLAAHPNILFVL